MDEKQLSIIRTWLHRSEDPAFDSYGAFMSLWVAFNAFCYAKYAQLANRRRADLVRDKGLDGLPSEPVRAEGSIRRDAAKIKLELEKPGRVGIWVSERYTEDIIFLEFAREYGDLYTSLLKEPEFEKQVTALQESLAKGKWHYVVNMALAAKHDPNGDYEYMAGKNIIVPFEDRNDLDQLKDVLYQVRCNVFHGEKVPGDPNDDRIVQAAHPVLRRILLAALSGAT